MYNVIKKLIDKRLSVSTCESITGGLVAKTITDVPGSSSIFSKGYICYSNDAKIKILNVDNSIINKYGVVSKEVAYEMANELYKMSKCDICISTTGNAGPTVCDDKPVGRVYIGIAFKGKINTYEFNINKSGSDVEIRDYIRNKANENIFNEIDKLLK